MLGTVNPADLFTKYLPREVSVGHCLRLSLQFRDGRAEAAPQLSSVMKAIFDYDEPAVLPAEGEEDAILATVQAMLNTMWHRRWKAVVQRNAQRVSTDD